jgi:RNA polymerase sigma factor (sigma-70 family)
MLCKVRLEQVMNGRVRQLRTGIDRDSSRFKRFERRLNGEIHWRARSILRRRGCLDFGDKAVVVTARVSEKLLDKAFPNYDCSRPFFPWLGGVVSMACSELMRRENARNALLQKHPLRVIRVNPCKSPVTTAAQREIQLLVRQAVEQLPDDCRRAIELRLFEGMSRAEAAEVCNVSEQTISNWRFRALQLLAPMLKRVYIADVA